MTSLKLEIRPHYIEDGRKGMLVAFPTFYMDMELS